MDTIEMRNELEKSFVSMAFASSCRGRIRPNELVSLCPVRFVQSEPAHSLYRAIVELDIIGEPIQVPTVWQHICRGREAAKNDNTLERWSDIGPQDLADYALSIYAENDEAVKHTAIKVANEGRKREAENKMLGLIGLCQQFGRESGDIASGLQALIQEVEGAVENIPTDMSELMSRVVSNAENGEQAKPVPTPWGELNRVLKGGFVPGELIILAARPGMGKTALAGCIAVEVARTGKPVLFISREVKDLTIGNRLTAREARIDLAAFRQFVDRAPNVIEKIKFAAQRLSPLPLRVIEKSIAPMSPREVRRIAKSIPNIGLIVVDYLQLLCPDTKSNSREREVAEMSRSMKQLALDCDCPVLLLSQINRSSEEAGRPPRLSDLRESGAIEQDADIVIFIHATQGHQALAQMPVQAIVAKGRSSGTGTAKLKFVKPFSDFVDDDGTTPVNAAVQRNDVGFSVA